MPGRAAAPSTQAAPATPERTEPARPGQAQETVDALGRGLGRLTQNVENLAGLGWDLRAHTPSPAQTQAIGLMLTDLEAKSPRLPTPWVMAQMDAGVMLLTGLLRIRLLQLGHQRMTLHLSDVGFMDGLCGRWRWRREGGWQFSPWTQAEAQAGGARPHAQKAPDKEDIAKRLAYECERPASLALEALMVNCAQDFHPSVEECQLNVCSSSRQLAALIEAGSLPMPVALFVDSLGPGSPTEPASASLVRGFDIGGPYLLTSDLHGPPEVLRSPQLTELLRPCAAAEHAAFPQASDSAILAGLCHQRPIGALSELLLPQGLAELIWLDLPALRLLELHQSCGGNVPIYTARLGRAQRLNGPALNALCRQQLDKLRPG